jgi:hypothetical protein
MAKSLSHSSCELWEKCPLAWKLTKLDHVPQAPAAPLIFGDAIHQALAADGLVYLYGGPRPDTHALYDVFQEALEDRLRRDDPTGLIPLADVAQMGLDAEAIFAGYVEHVQPYYFPLAVEQWFGKEPAIPIPDADGWTFTGIVDARIRTNQGQAIVDFKTGKRWEVGAEHGKGQASAYLYADEARVLISAETNTDAADMVIFILLPVENGVCFPARRITTRDHSQRFAYVEHLRTVAREIDEARASGDFPAKTGPLCAYCGCLASCETGQNWLHKARRESHVPGVTL